MTSIFLSFFLLMLCGMLWRFLPRVPSGATVRVAISAVVMNILLPALTFKVLYNAPLSHDIWQVPVTALVSCVVSVILAVVVYQVIIPKMIALPMQSRGAMILAAGWGNVTYLGIPIVTALVGEEFQRVPIYFDLLSLTPLLWSLGVVIATRYGTATNHVHPFTHSIQTLVRLPPIYAAILGLACNALHIPIPEFIVKACSTAAVAVAPLMIISVGIALRWTSLQKTIQALPAVVLKLAVVPIVAILITQQLGITGGVYTATIAESAMPTMVLTMVVSEQFGLDSELLAQAIAISTVLSFITIPLWCT